MVLVPPGRSPWVVPLAFALLLGCEDSALEQSFLQPEAGCTRLVAATYNIRAAIDEDYRRWEARADAVVSTVVALEASILGLQEAYGDQQQYADQVRDLEQRLPGYSWVGEGRDGDNAGEHNPIFFRTDTFELLASGTFWLSDTPDEPRLPDEQMPWGSRMNRIATWARLEHTIGGRSVLVLNTHLAYRSSEARLQSARLIVEVLANGAAEDDLVLVLGDFNEAASGDALAVLEGTRPAAVNLSSPLTNTYNEADRVTLNRFGTTMTFWWSLGIPTARFDHILESGAHYVSSWEAVAERYAFDGSQKRYYPSDHLPVRIELCY